MSCGGPADMEIEPVFRPFTARGERACEMLRKLDTKIQNACVDCLMRTGEAIARGDMAEEES